MEKTRKNTSHRKPQTRYSKGVRLLGCFCVFLSAFCFYLATVVVRWSEGVVAIDPAYFVFARFLLGFAVVVASMAAMRTPLKPVRYHLLFGRMIANCVAVFCFFKAVSATTAAEANILNMTYPLFIAVISWFLLPDQRDVRAIGMVAVAFAGIWLILSPSGMKIDVRSFWGLASGVTASAAILYLNVSRRYHDTQTILFFMFGPGAALIYVCFHDKIFVPDATELLYLLLCASSGIAGQYLLTLGFRYVTAVEGSIVSSTRILLAAVLGPFLAGEPALGISGWVGAILIFGANIFLAFHSSGPRRDDKGGNSKDAAKDRLPV